MYGAISFTGKLQEAIRRQDPLLLFDIILDKISQISSPVLKGLLESLKVISAVQIIKPNPNSRKDITSAALVRRDSKFYLVFNSAFLMDYIKTCDDLCHLVLHELSHKLRGDLRRSVSSKNRLYAYIINITMDMLNDAILRRNLFHEPPGYLRKLYDKNNHMQLLAPPEVLLCMNYRNIENTKRENLAKLLYIRFSSWKGLKKEGRRKLAEIYLTGWLDNPSFDSIFKRLLKVLLKYSEIDEVSKNIFLGSYLWSYYITNGWDEWFFNNVFCQLFDKQGGYSEHLNEEQIDYFINEKHLREILDLIKKAVTKGTVGHSIGNRMVTKVGVVPFMKRKQAYLLNGGYTPIFYPNTVSKKQSDESKLNLYLDVSRSVMNVLPFLYGLIVRLQNELTDPIYLFSNKVIPVSRRDIKQGFVKTTEGTDFDCVAEHALNHRFKKILVVTDGFGTFQVFKERLKKECEVYAVLTSKYVNSDIIDVAGGINAENKRWWMMKEK